MASTTHPEEARRVPSQRSVYLVPGVGLFLLLCVLGFPVESGAIRGLSVAIAFAAVCSSIFGFLVAKRNTLGATLVLSFSVAYAIGCGDTATHGVTRVGIYVPPTAIASSLVALSTGLAVLALAAHLSSSRIGKLFQHRERESGSWIGFVPSLGFGLLTLAEAIRTNTYSFWVGSGEEQASGPSQGFELLYPAMLFALAGILATPGLRPTVAGVRSRALVRGLGLAVAAGIFVLQSRRAMVAATAVAVMGIWLARTRRGQLHELLRQWRPIAAGAFLLVVALVASSSFRRATDASSFTARLATTVEDFGQPEVSEQVTDRASYLWMDGLIHYLGEPLQPRNGIPRMIVSQAVTSTPYAILPEKRQYEQLSCDFFVEPAGIYFDVPCTPAGEGFLLAGWWGTYFAMAFWGLTLGVAEAMFRTRRPGLALMGLLLAFPLYELELGMAAPVICLRQALIGFPIWALVWFVVAAAVHAFASSGRRPSGLTRVARRPRA